MTARGGTSDMKKLLLALVLLWPAAVLADFS
ncbi:MAG: hypothetical protein ACI9DC_003431 [Gammaproteobacteria bacterium]|jgi:hypothetical protein